MVGSNREDEGICSCSLLSTDRNVQTTPLKNAIVDSSGERHQIERPGKWRPKIDNYEQQNQKMKKNRMLINNQKILQIEKNVFKKNTIITNKFNLDIKNNKLIKNNLLRLKI